jgi:[acyl-carrier-protein] S-malonyltransferase
MPDLTAALFTASDSLDADPGALVRRHEADVVAGHGLGDLAALSAAGVLDPGDARALAGMRDAFLRDAAHAEPGGLLAVLDVDAEAAARCVAALTGVRLARHDSPACVVLAGTRDELMRARMAADELRLRTRDLPGRAALHGAGMARAADRFAAAVADVPLGEAHVPVYSSVTATLMADPRAELVRCLVEPVLWRQTVHALATAGAGRFVQSAGARELSGHVVETLTGDEPAGVEAAGLELVPA